VSLGIARAVLRPASGLIEAVRPAPPLRARGFVTACFAATALLFLIYLFAFELNVAEWNPYGSPLNIVVTFALTAVLTALLHLLTGRFWFSAIAGMGLILVLAAWSELKFRMNGFSLTLVDLFIIDPASISFAFSQPDFRWHITGALGLIALLAAVFVLEGPGRMKLARRLVHLVVAIAVLAGVLRVMMPNGARDAMHIGSAFHITVFAKSLFATADYFQQSGVLEKSAPGPGAAAPGPVTCVAPAGAKLPHIIVISDEASIDTNRLPSLKPDPALDPHFISFDGSRRSTTVETYGGGTWLTELSVLTGLSTRSFGPFAPVATRMVADRVEKSLPEWLGQCGYETRSIYPAGGRFVSARRMHDGLGVRKFEDWFDLKAKDPTLSDALQLRDRIYYRYALERLQAEPAELSFTFLWLTGNHTPWTNELSPEIRFADIPPSPTPEIAEYRRRQRLSDLDLRWLKDELVRTMPDQPFLIVRYGDHLPFIGGSLIDPQLTEDEAWRHINALDSRYFRPYFAVDTVNYAPPGVMPRPETISVSYFGLMILDLIGLPRNPVAQYQASVIDRCGGLFSECENGAVVRQFNGWLAKHGVVVGL
jgi:phosphoglycerol transferase MdoB-like AlkP superfamily enzyme